VGVDLAQQTGPSPLSSGARRALPLIVRNSPGAAEPTEDHPWSGGPQQGHSTSLAVGDTQNGGPSRSVSARCDRGR